MFTSDQLFGFQYTESGEREGMRVSVVYVARDDVAASAVEKHLRKHFLKTHLPHRVVILGPDTESRRRTLVRLGRDKQLARTPIVIPNSPFDGKIEYTVIRADGSLAALSSDGATWAKADTDLLFGAGLGLMFRANGAVVDGTDLGFHFVVPSGRHQAALVRVGNVFSRGSQTAFAASSLLRFVPSREFESIYVDSSSIGALAHELAAQLWDLGRSRERPGVSSFGGYDGLGSLDWPQPHGGSLVLISYSATGGLAQQLHESTGLATDGIVTLFANENRPGLSEAACMLGKENGLSTSPSSAFPGERYASSRDSPTCELCERGQSPIVVKGDQLLPMSPRTRTVALTVRNVPPNMKTLMRDLIIHDAITVNAREVEDALPSLARELHLDLTKLAKELGKAGASGEVVKPAREALIAAAQPVEGREVELIVHLDDEPSIAMATVVRDEIRKTREFSDDRVIGFGQLIDGRGRQELGFTKVVVVAGAVASARNIQIVGQVLRAPHAEGAIQYVILFARQDSDITWNRVKQNLTRTGENHQRFRVSDASRIEFPANSLEARTSWQREHKFWNEWVLTRKAPLLPEPSAPQRALAGLRSGQLVDPGERPQVPGHDQIAETGPGLRTTLFLDELGAPSLQSDPQSDFHLRLRPGFAFWKFRYVSLKPVQADVYATIAAALNWLRSPHDDRPPAIGQAHNRTVIDPADFTRFSDGIVQAALLRAARPSELDYSNDPDLSAAVVRVVTNLIRDGQNDAADKGNNALPEFMLAIAMDSLRLHEDHVTGFVETLNKRVRGISPASDLLLEIIRTRFGL